MQHDEKWFHHFWGYVVLEQMMSEQDRYWKIRKDLQGMGWERVSELATKQPRKWCIIGSNDCPDYFIFDGLGWCVSELFGRPCRTKQS